jgi:signal transduction histidine kinase
VTGAPAIRFYAGVPLSVSSGRRVGTLCIIDAVPRVLSESDKSTLTDLARWAESELTNVNLTRAVVDLEAELARRHEFTTTIAHEVRTPLTSIRAALGLVTANDGPRIGPAERDMLSIANRNCARLAAVLADFLELENLDRGQAPLRPQRHALTALMASAIAAESPRAAEAGVELKMACSPVDATVYVDGENLRRCLVRVLSNAIKFSARGQRVEIDAQTTAVSALIAVRDHGPGIPASYMSRLFRPFSQADASDSRLQAGAGLGLAITRQWVERMGGSIAVDCPPEGGTRVMLRFPVSHPAGS